MRAATRNFFSTPDSTMSSGTTPSYVATLEIMQAFQDDGIVSTLFFAQIISCVSVSRDNFIRPVWKYLGSLAD